MRILGAAVIALVVISSVGCDQRRSDGKSVPPAIASHDSTRSGTDSASAQQFVESFYAWYTPYANADRYPAWWRILTSRAGNLDDNLLLALRADSAAGRGPEASTRETLDFDPFLDSQDPCPRYEAMEARREKALYLVTVRPRCPDTTWQTQRPVVAVYRAAGEWKIVNVFYEKYDLMGLLCQFAREDKRRQPPPRGC